MSLENVLNHLRTVAVICSQWGDTGKGKIVDYLAASWADVIFRGTGGNNAGHTVVVDGETRIFHLIPSGIRYDKQGKMNILGNGMVLDISVLVSEMDDLDKAGYSYDNLRISEDAHLILPFHIAEDKNKNQSLNGGGIGSTGRGIGPAYTSKIKRSGVMVKDLYSPTTLKQKIVHGLESYLDSACGELTRLLVQDDNLSSSLIADALERLGVSLSDREKELLNYRSKDSLLEYFLTVAYNIDVEQEADDIIATLEPLAKRIKPHVLDTFELLHDLRTQDKRILIEGAQGTLLSVEYGTYKYVTSSDPSINGAAQGCGLSAADCDLVFLIAKFPFMTRVGGGPFPTEFGGKRSDLYCRDDSIRVWDELKRYDIPFSIGNNGTEYDKHHPNILKLIASNDPFERGIGIRLAAYEYGATTGRCRRTGRTDAEAARFAAARNGENVLWVITKPDCMSNTGPFEIATHYTLDFKKIPFKRTPDILERVKPAYKTYESYGAVRDVNSYDALPVSLRQALDDFEDLTGRQVALVSTGPEQREMIYRLDVLQKFLLKQRIVR